MTTADAERMMVDRSARRRAAGVSLLIAVSILWSLGGVAIKLSDMPGVSFAFYRAVAAALAMSLLMPLSSGQRPPMRWMAFSAIVYTIVVTLLMISMRIGTAASGILLQYTSPVFCALFAWIFQRRGVGRRTALAMVIAAGGIGIMLFGGMLLGKSSGGIIGPLCGLVSGIAFGALPLVLEKIDRAAGGRANPFQIVLFNNLGAVLLLLPICWAWKIPLRFEPWQFALVGATGMFQLAVPYVLFQHGLRRVTPVDASLLILLEPVLNPLWVVLIVREIPSTLEFIGGAAILVAMVLEATNPAPEK